ncbi:MAG: hypothetical protein GY714_07550 [Desulfobacterales bacterium]|nr:hypothetical protein [Desulfobacterales bacterium]MCP4161378.1 hypothetical protein [Deltaproteobacteria bacterium]
MNQKQGKLKVILLIVINFAAFIFSIFLWFNEFRINGSDLIFFTTTLTTYSSINLILNFSLNKYLGKNDLIRNKEVQEYILIGKDYQRFMQ